MKKTDLDTLQLERAITELEKLANPVPSDTLGIEKTRRSLPAIVKKIAEKHSILVQDKKSKSATKNSALVIDQHLLIKLIQAIKMELQPVLTQDIPIQEDRLFGHCFRESFKVPNLDYEFPVENVL